MDSVVTPTRPGTTMPSYGRVTSARDDRPVDRPQSPTTSDQASTPVDRPVAPGVDNRDDEARLIDTFGRVATDLRLSVTDRCNLRCTYCLPDEQQDWIARDDLLSVDEYARLVRIGLDLGVTDVRITGGEPLLRPDLEQIICAIRDAFVDRDMPVKIAMTTNAVNMAPRVDGLIAAGLQRINVSLDSLDPARYAALSKRDRLPSVLESLEAVRDSALTPVKINTVILDHDTLAEVPAIIDYCLQRGFRWRAIEYMPIGPLQQQDVVRPTLDDILATIRQHWDITPRPTDLGAPARRWTVRGKHAGDGRAYGNRAHDGRELGVVDRGHAGAGSNRAHDDRELGVVGVIASESAPFCANCERTRISADGKIYSCLFSTHFTDILGALRGGASDAEVAQLWRDAMWAKPAGHQALSALPITRTMSQIGG